MSSPGGGFQIPVGFDITAALAALQALQSAGRTTAGNMSTAFGGIRVSLTDIDKIIQQLQGANKAAEELKSKGEIRITFRDQGVGQVQQAFQDTLRAAQELAGKKFTVQINANSKSFDTDLHSIRQTLEAAEKGQTVNLNLKLNEEEAEAALKELTDDFKEAERRGVRIAVTLDTQGAKADAARAAADIQREADQAKDKAQREADRKTREATRAANQVRVAVTVDGADTSAATLRRLTEQARALNQNIRLNINADGKNVNSEIERIRQGLQSLQKGDVANLNLNMKAPDSARVIAAIRADIEDLRRRGARIDVNINPQTQGGRGNLSQVLGGAGRGLVAGSGVGGNLLIGANFTAAAAGGLAAAVAVQALTQAIIASTQASIQYNAQLELTRNTFEFFTGSAEAAGAAMANLRKLAAQSPLSEQETLTIGASFLRITGGDVQRMQQLTELTTALASARPELGFERIQGAIQQLVSGDFEAFDDRMNITIGTTRELARQGFSGMELFRRAVEAAGGSLELMNKNSQSFTVRLSNLQGSIEGINAALGRGAFEGLSEAIGQANNVLANHQATWEKLAEAIGRAAAAGFALNAKAIGFPGLEEVLKNAEALALVLEKINGTGKAGAPPEPSERQQQRSALTTQRETTSGELAKQKKDLDDIEKQLRANKNAADAIKAPYEAALIPLRAQLAQIQVINQALEAQAIAAQKATVEADQKRETARGDPAARADLAAEKFSLDIEKEKQELQQRREQRAEAIAELEENMARRVRDAELETRKTILEGLKEELRQRQENRNAALEALKEEYRQAQQTRQEAIEGLREENRQRQQNRQEMLDALREEIRERQEARNSALEAMREEIRARQEARSAAIDAIREEIRVRGEARQAAIEAIREEIRQRREAYDLALQAQRDLADDAERNYRNAEEAADRQHRRTQERYREQIERLRERDQRLSRDEGKSPAERELEALEKQSRERQRLQSIADAEAGVYNARTGRERREAQRRLEQLRVEQAEERKKEALQEQAEREKEAREKAREQRQQEIAALERKAQEEDRKFQREKEARELAHKQQVEQLEAARRTEERAEEARRREEDRQVREAEKAAKAAEKAEQAQLREAEKADREATKAENAQIRAQEQANKAADRAEAAQIRSEERANKAEEQAEAAALREAERAAKAQERAEQAEIRALERAAKAEDQANQARIRAEEAAIRQAERAERERRAAEDTERDRIRLERLKEMKVIEDAIDENRRKTLDLINVSLGAQAERDATIAENLVKVAENLKKLDELQKAILALPIKAEIEKIEAEMGAKLVDLETTRLKLEGDLNKTQDKIDDLKKQLDELNKQITALNGTGSDGKPLPKPGEPGFIGPILPPTPEKDLMEGAVKWADFMRKTWPQILGESMVKIWGEVSKGIINWLLGDQSAIAQAATKFIDNAVKTPIERLLEVNSPSALSQRWMEWVGEGMLLGLGTNNVKIQETLLWPFWSFQEEYLPAFMAKFTEQMAAIQEVIFKAYEPQKVAEHLETPFIDFQDNYYPAFDQKLGEQLDTTVLGIKTKWEQAGIAASLETPFIEFQDAYMPAFIEKLREQGTQAATAFVEAWQAYDIEAKIEIRVNQGFTRFGREAGEKFCEGWTQAMRGCPCPDCSAAPPPNPKPGPNPKPEFSSEAARAGARDFFPSVDVGPSVGFGTNAVTNVASSSSVRGPVSISVQNTVTGIEGMSMEELSETITAKTIDRVIDVLDFTEASTPDTVGRGLPGAL